jgi:glycosyltransferase involved in cell wall biosynthesis
LLEAHGRINAYTFQADPSLRALVDVVPYGLPEELPKHTRNVIKGVWSGIHDDDRLLLWGGGLWPWFDPATAVRAIARIRHQRPKVKLIFPGTRHPNPMLDGIPTHTEATRVLTGELGQLETGVFFGDWLPYTDWPNALLESAVALTFHGPEALESHLAFRSRVLEYIWAGLPTVATDGDVTSDLIMRYHLGEVVSQGDDAGAAEAIMRLLDQPPGLRAENFHQARQALTWERAARPLINFCRQPRRAPDKVKLGEQLGHPYYTHNLTRWRKFAEERDAAATWYEQHGLIMRLMKLVDRLRVRANVS